MKKLFLSLSLLATMMCFHACSTDVELYADYKDIPIIYGLIDASQDTNFIRINRAFSGSNDHYINANEVALIEDSCNYPGKLNAYIVEYKEVYGGNYSPTGEVLPLDTMTIHDKKPGVFYSPNQKVYFTNGILDNGQSAFGNNSANAKYKYKLFVHRGNDTITAETSLVGGSEFKIITSSLSFAAAPSDNTKKIKFVAADNAVFYDVKVVFHYQESLNGGPLVDKSVSFSSGPKSVDELGKEDMVYYVSYGENVLFNLLKEAIGGDTIIDNNHPNVVRYIDNTYPLELFVSAGGDELYNYIQVNTQSGFSQTVPDYTNVTGGFGVFSSRINLQRDAMLSSGAKRDLYGKRAWGFIEH
jgi:hypothetical protein